MKKARPAPFPSHDQILKFIQESPRRVGKREIARAFNLDADQKRTLKKVLREMELDGRLERGRGRRVADPNALPAVFVVEVTGTDIDGELLARPVDWRGDGPPPRILIVPDRRRGVVPGPGERALVRLTEAADGVFEARVMRRLQAAPNQVLGVYDVVDGLGRLRPTDRRARGDFVVENRDSKGAVPGDLVRAEPLPARRLGLRQARVVERISAADGPAVPSIIAIADYDLPTRFTPDVEAQAQATGPAPAKGRDDFRDMALVTIDGADARDFDDAVWAEPDPKVTGGWHLIVAIADVAWYVRPGDALDRCAYERGNSVYFPDRVVPMLPEALSNGWCSLKPHEDRPCVAVHMWIDADGRLTRHRFRRGVMRSAARLTYEQVQAAADGRPDETTGQLLDPAIKSLYGAYRTLEKSRRARGALELELPERRVEIAPDGTVAAIGVRERLDSHKLIEEFMIAANVAAAETLEKRAAPTIYRIHDEPPADKLEALHDALEGIGLSFSKGGVVTAKRFNQVLAKAADTPNVHLVNEMVLRTQAQAEYAPGNIGHFGLALRRYCHFTSPIRRYADLVVHRALITAEKLGAGGLGNREIDLARIGEHISMTERRAAGAERDAVDRFAAMFMADRIGATFAGRINGVTRFGLFVTLEETGTDGLVPIRALPDDYYIHDEARHALRGRRSKREYRMGDSVEIRLVEAEPVTGGMIFDILDSGRPAGSGARGKTRQRRARGGPGRGRGRRRA